MHRKQKKNLNKKVLLCILDGFSFGDENCKYNAYALAKKVNFPKILAENPWRMLKCSGSAVGLLEKQMGNSEVGHLTIGSGRIIPQLVCKIDNYIKNGSLKSDKNIQEIKNFGKNVHIIGLFSNGGVHSKKDHIIAIANELQDYNKVFLHIITDGRDCAQKVSLEEIKNFEKIFNIVTISGRYFAMDRDNRIERSKKYYDILFNNSNSTEKPSEYIANCYNRNQTDEFIEPKSFNNFSGIKEDDIIIFANFSPDRIRQIVKMIFQEKKYELNGYIMTDYFADNEQTANKLKLKILFPKEEIKNTLCEILSKNYKKQLKIAETEKYAHITFFFNGEKESPFENEDRILIPSKKVSYYNEIPEMSAYEIRDKVIENLDFQRYDFIVCNIANGDMIGHTGDLQAGIKAIEVIDEIIGDFYNSAKKNDYILIIAADHGNIECMFDEKNNEIFTQHTIGEVPFILCNYETELQNFDASLANIAPTILDIMNIEIPENMQRSLIKRLAFNDQF